MTPDLIEAAQARLHGYMRVTPMLNSPFLDQRAGRRVFVKAETLQHTGSFKFRGAWSALSALDAATRQKGVLAFSSGNHAQAVALAAREHGSDAVIIMPSDAPKLKIENTGALGAEVILYDRAREDREALGARLAQERELTLIKPFDDPLVIAGQGTCGLEIAAQARVLGIQAHDVLVCCGGGGLSSGIAVALAQMAPDLSVRPVEPEGFDDVARSLKAGEIRRNATQGGSLCDAIVTPSPGDVTFPLLKTYCGGGLVVPEEDCLKAMALAFSRLKLVLEPGGAIALAAALFHPDQIEGDDVIVIASGGNVDPEVFQMALERYGRLQ